MAVFLVANIKINDNAKYKEYTDKARPILEKYNAEYLVNSVKINNLKNGINPDKIIVIKFPSKTHYENCFNSSEYKKIANLRLESTQSSAYLVEE